MSNDNEQKYIFAVGRRKTSTARIRLFQGKGENMIVDGENKEIKFEDIYKDKQDQKYGYSPFVLTNTNDQYYFTVKINGGGKSGQLGALRHALSRALSKESEEYRKILRSNDFLTRDPRMVERKKIYHKKARKSPQFSKR